MIKSPQQTPVQFIKGVGPARMKLFERLGVRTVEDLFYLFPRRYEDRRRLTPIAELRVGEWQTIMAEVVAKGGRRSFYNRKHLFEITVADEKARIRCVWFNQPYLESYIQVGDQIVLYGRVEVFKDHLQVISPEYEVIKEGDEGLSTARIVPVYPLTKGMSQRYLRKIMHTALEQYAGGVIDVIPEVIRQHQGLKPIGQSLSELHFPDDDKSREDANRRVSFEEFFLFQIAVILRRMTITHKKGVAHFISPKLVERFRSAFPFEFTAAQTKAISEIAQDMAAARPMLRLLQGDVGSGKTVVSFFGCLAAVASGHQAAILAPTEILAEQHFATFNNYFKDGPFGDVRSALLTGALKKKDKDALGLKIRSGEVDVVIGTHSLLLDEIKFKDLSFVAVDEQHKFGVKQRALLSSKGQDPDVLVMTATPIPRTLCLTLYGDLDVSVINEKPKGRGEIKTYHVKEAEASGIYQRVREWVQKGTQAYIVYPIIEETEKVDLKAAVEMYERFQREEFKDLRVGLIHGRLKAQETQATMEKFKRHELDVLVTTTVLEVGIDVSNANIMVIEHAERFGLAQLHQLRGRIGRSEKSAVCILLGDPDTDESRMRLEAILKSTDGFKIAEKDLEIRGPGQYFGRHQHGLNELRVVNPLTQIDVLEAARKEAAGVVKEDPGLIQAHHRLIKKSILERYPEYLERVNAG
jgi:ATP-dependent DNA helicase RecG